MLKKIIFWVVLICFSGLQAQELNSLYKTKKMLPSRDTIHLEQTSINSGFFKISDTRDQPIDTAFYQVNFPKGTPALPKMPMDT
jgi:hypothetical protein